MINGWDGLGSGGEVRREARLCVADGGGGSSGGGGGGGTVVVSVVAVAVLGV